MASLCTFPTRDSGSAFEPIVSLPLAKSRPKSIRHALTWLAWTALAIGVSLGVLFGKNRTVTTYYHESAAAWMDGHDLYRPNGMGFIYLPQAAVLFSPFNMLHQPLADVLWRTLSLAVLAWGVWRLAALVRQHWQIEVFPEVSLLTMVAFASCARNGQATLLMTAMMLHAIVDLHNRNWWRATAWLSLGLMIKPLIVVLWLLSAALFKPMRLRLATGFLIVLAVPFFTQSPEYVARQYQAAVTMLTTASKLGMETTWAHPFGALRVAGVEVPNLLQTGIRAVLAVATLAACWFAIRSKEQRFSSLYLLAFSTVYILLMNPRSENSTYGMLGPALGLFAVIAWKADRRPFLAGFLVLLTGLMVGSYELGKLLTPGERPIWLAPLAATAFAMYLVTDLIRRQPEVADVVPFAQPAQFKRRAA